jgi:BTB/POZ domain
VYFSTHKLILAALVFVLTSEMVEGSGHTVTDMKSIVLGTMLHFMYSGSLSNMEELNNGGLRLRNVFNSFNTIVTFSSLKV